jgi:N-methylhydantoinase A/oxoprolinase/acetone carboxylase beta subunit
MTQGDQPADGGGIPTGIGLGIDAGGTFTDAVIYDLSGNALLAKNKALTTKWNFAEGIDASLKGLDPHLLESVDLVAVSTTLATNAIVEGRGQKVGLLFMPPYGLFEPGDIPYEPKARVSGRLEITGETLEPVDEAEIGRIARMMVEKHQVKAFAVSGFAGTINPDHELQVKRVLQRETGLSVSCGHELSEILNFRTRAHTAVMNGRIIPLLAKLLSDVRQVMRRYGIRAPLAVVRGDGTLMSGEAACARPVETILSGPAASAAGARHLTGKRDAIVADMGGTTTDVAMLAGGEVCTDDGGSHVGEHKTHVRALRTRTLGLGGDSFISWNRGSLQIGPGKVVPAAWAGAHVRGMDRALEYYRAHRHFYINDTRRLQLLIPRGVRDGLALTDQELQVVGLLEERVCGPQELAERMGLSFWNPGITERLEQNYLIERCGYTPTDVLNGLGETRLWDVGASKRMSELMAEAFGLSSSEMNEKLKREMTRRFALGLFKRQLDEETDVESMEHCPVCRELFGKILGERSNGYDISLRLHLPVVGIGTPVGFFLPGASALLGAEAVMPPHSDVANAIGAITSQVVIRRRAEIRTYKDFFRVEGLPGAGQFKDLLSARIWAETHLIRMVREIAAESGTLETRVEVRDENRVHTMPNGKPLFMGCSLHAELRGRPVSLRFEQCGTGSV